MNARCSRTTAVGALLSALVSILCRGAAGDVRVTAEASEIEIVRQTPHGPERCLYLSIANTGTTTFTGLTLQVTAKGRRVALALLDVPPGEVRDTLWAPEDGAGTLPARLVDSAGGALWSGDLKIAPGRRIVIPHSPTLTAADLKPLMLRGLNYYPRSQPWAGLWRAMTEKELDAEFSEMDQLNINTIRTFAIFDSETGLHGKDGSFSPLLTSRINTLLRVADRHHVKVMFCLIGGPGAPMTDLGWWRRYIRTCVEPFRYDGRVLMWDLINEPGGNDGPRATPELARWIQAMYPEMKRDAPNHLATIGLCWQFDQLWDLGVMPDVGQYHDYSGAVGVQPAGQPPVRNVADGLRDIVAKYTGPRPLIIGEYGLYSETGSEKTEQERAAALAYQADICRWVLQGAEAVKIAGLYNWVAFQFTPAWMGRKEQTFGVIRPDGSLKPAGVLIRDTYRRWRAQSPAPWEARTRRAKGSAQSLPP